MRHHLYITALALGIAACAPAPRGNRGLEPLKWASAPAEVSTIAFGSCAEEDKPQPILRQVLRDQPDLFIYLGDNVYGDTEDMDVLKKKYQELEEKREFRDLVQGVHTIATWDDHDYGANDAGRHYAHKEESKEIFMDFWREPADSPRRGHPGIYGSKYFGEGARRVQVILLDTRTFRDDLIASDGQPPHKNEYQPNMSEDSTFLGEAQWKWLAAELRQPATFRIIASSNQFCHAYNGYESWNNVPREQKRMIQTFRDARAEGVVFISGDVHWGELSMRKAERLYPIYDLTSSGITETWPKVEPNEYRIGNPEPENNYGLISIDWQEDPVLTLSLKTVNGSTSVTQSIRRSELAITTK